MRRLFFAAIPLTSVLTVAASHAFSTAGTLWRSASDSQEMHVSEVPDTSEVLLDLERAADDLLTEPYGLCNRLCWVHGSFRCAVGFDRREWQVQLQRPPSRLAPVLIQLHQSARVQLPNGSNVAPSCGLGGWSVSGAVCV